MSGIAPRRVKAAFDPLLNPSAMPPTADEAEAATSPSPVASPSAPRSLLSLAKAPTEQLKKMALSSNPPVASPSGDDVPAQSMAEFLGIATDDKNSAAAKSKL